MKLAERIQKARMLKGLSQGDLAEKIGIRQQTIQKLERGINKSTSYIVPLAKELDVDPAWLQFGAGKGPEAVSDLYEKMPDGHVPIISWKEAVIFSHPFVDASKLSKITEYIINPHPSKKYKNLYALRIMGDSMIGQPKSFNPGSIILIDPLLSPKHGDFIVIHDGKPENEPILRKLTIESGISWLSALNPNYGPVRNLADFDCIGTVIAHIDILRD